MAGRPAKYPEGRVQMQVRLPKKLRTRLQKEADRRYVSKVLLVERALTESLDRWEQEERLVASP
jgi:predicted transcriptional regulator